MAISLRNQSALVVGASSGIGRAVAVALAAEGARVTAAARRQDRLLALEQEVRAAGGTIQTVCADVTVREDVRRMVAAALESFGALDLMVYATGTNVPDRAFAVLKPETWDMMVQVNLTGAFNCTYEVVPLMRQAGGGLIIYISTISVQVPDVSGAAYQASKHGLSGLAHAVRLEEKANGIRTSVIFPGLCRTELLEKRPAPTPPEILAHALEPEDVADAVIAVARLHPRAVAPELVLLPSRL